MYCQEEYTDCILAERYIIFVLIFIVYVSDAVLHWVELRSDYTEQSRYQQDQSDSTAEGECTTNITAFILNCKNVEGLDMNSIGTMNKTVF